MWSWLVSDLLCSVVITMSRMDSIWLTQLTPTDITQDFTTWTHYVYWISQIIKCTREDQLYGSNGIAKNRMHCQSRDTLFKCITNFSHNPLEWASGRVYNLLHGTRGFEKLFLFFCLAVCLLVFSWLCPVIPCQRARKREDSVLFLFHAFLCLRHRLCGWGSSLITTCVTLAASTV